MVFRFHAYFTFLVAVLLERFRCSTGDYLNTTLTGNTNQETAFFMDTTAVTAVIGQSKYTIVKKNVDFTVAVKECSKIGAVLADFKDQAEKDELVKFIQSVIPSYIYGLWVSGLLVGHQGRPAWLYTGKLITSDLWVRGGMNTANCTKTCTALFWIGSDTGFGFLPCTGKRHYAICKQ